ncbi:type 1 glutamine amidotransferase domain-containing protein [Nocardia sp. 2]|uniref:Type 1 glutamine amidotransferase domain-containing protein n=1 Tax=Nocardia acididurans TaxID=2802282 RepID=A0ABS1MCC1_9NOCA|nr:type 1 glutamine amidotransferase domain-containing protein [Nocardia acididurans]MBL1078232.1 type 1 glutamine amidotransferase domain-containing protein [Nocardia acididurans]
MAKILFVMTGVDHWTLADGSKHPTGYWAEEFAAPYEAFRAAGHEIVVATPGAAVPTVDGGSLAPDVNGGPAGAERIAALLKRATELTHPIRLEDVALTDYDAVYYPGGHGPMEDLAVNADSGRLLDAALASGKPLGIVCHAPAALLATADADGRSPFAGYRATGFTNAEETQAGFADKAKWLLQDRLVALGVDFRAGEPWAPHLEIDRNLYTGQNPASSAPLAAELLKAL